MNEITLNSQYSYLKHTYYIIIHNIVNLNIGIPIIDYLFMRSTHYVPFDCISGVKSKDTNSAFTESYWKVTKIKMLVVLISLFSYDHSVDNFSAPALIGTLDLSSV